MDQRQDDKTEPRTGEHTTSFGFDEVPEDRKAGLVRGVFDSVASRYDIMNDVMSMGVHRLWKDAMVGWLNPRPGFRILDVAGGTGDIAFRMLDAMAARDRKGLGGTVVVSDINEQMLRAGLPRAEERETQGKPVPLAWVTGDAQTLPFPDNHFDAYTIAFGIRNVTRRAEALAEARRVLKPGGRFLCLEFSRAVMPVLDDLYETWSFNVIPRLGGAIAGDADSYRYLVESIRRFPDQRAFAAELTEAGFGAVKVRNLSGGIAALHSGWRV